MDETISSIGSVVSTILSPKPGGKPSVPRSGGMPSEGIWTYFSINTPLGRRSSPGPARYPQAPVRREEAGNEPLRLVQLKVPAKSVQAEVLSREEIKIVLHDLSPSHPRLLNRCNQLNLLRKDFIVRPDVSDSFLQKVP